MTKWSVTDRVIFDSGRLRKVLVFGLFLALTATGGYFLYQQRPAGLPAGFDVIWRDLLAMTGVGACFFTVVLLRFRKAVTQTQV
jgi:hypothetical protein